MKKKKKPDSIFEWSVRWICCTKQRKREVLVQCIAFVPHTNWQPPVGIRRKERRTQTDEITPLDLRNETRFFYRLYARVRSAPYKTPEIKRPIKIT